MDGVGVSVYGIICSDDMLVSLNHTTCCLISASAPGAILILALIASLLETAWLDVVGKVDE